MALIYNQSIPNDLLNEFQDINAFCNWVIGRSGLIMIEQANLGLVINYEDIDDESGQQIQIHLTGNPRWITFFMLQWRQHYP